MPHDRIDVTTTLVKRAATDGGESLARLIELSEPFLRGRILRTRPELAAADVHELINDVWSSVIPKLGGMSLENGHRSYLNYLAVTVGRRVTAHIDRRLQQGATGGTDHRKQLENRISEEVPPVSVAEVRDFVETMMNGAPLTARDQEMLRLRFWEGWAGKEIAEHLGMEEGAARRAIARALQKLREWASGK